MGNRLMLLCFLVAANLRNFAEGLPSGAPASACSTLTPNPISHAADPQIGSVPYEVDLSELSDGGSFSYAPGMTYTCTLIASGHHF